MGPDKLYELVGKLYAQLTLAEEEMNRLRLQNRGLKEEIDVLRADSGIDSKRTSDK
jgi:hypothetical protein